MKYYVYIKSAYTGIRYYTNIYEAENKELAKQAILDDVDWLTNIRQKATKTMKEGDHFITSIHEINPYWESIFLAPQTCAACQTTFTKIDKIRFDMGGMSQFCSDLCEREYRERADPYSASWDNGTVYRITHKPTGKFYIGVTVRWIAQRWWEHMKAESGSKFHKFIKEAPIEEFTFEILEKFKPSEHNPFEREAYWITSLNALGELGLNSVNGHKTKEKVKDREILRPQTFDL